MIYVLHKLRGDKKEGKRGTEEGGEKKKEEGIHLQKGEGDREGERAKEKQWWRDMEEKRQFP